MIKWEDLIRFNNLCNASPLASIVFCCKVTKPCPYRDEALKILGISKERYTEVKEKYAIKAKGTCYGNLAYCCSLEYKCDIRDEALKRLGMSPSDYLKYKFKILKELIPEDKMMGVALKRRVSYNMAFEMVCLHNPNLGFRGIAVGNPNLSDLVLILNFQQVSPHVDVSVRDTLRKEKFISVRVSKDTYEKLVDLALVNGCSISDLVRNAINVYLLMTASGVEIEKYIKDEMEGK
ncbi:MAG TPA: hypothetical protein ENG66_06545 [Thermococcus sp.]|nr:MAG: hypothetical protein DRP04_03425 [Archaeoglobales archaeon]HDH45029.1 hypothetical protein [Thermococcus sp.]